MKGKLKKIDDKWFVEYSEWITKGGKKGVLGGYTRSINTKTLPLLMDSTTFPKDRSNFVVGSRVKFTEVLINPMGREVDPNDLGQNQSKCAWYARLDLRKNFYCGDEVDYGEQCDFQCDRCVDATGVDYGYLPNDNEKSKQEQKQHLIDMMKSDEELGLYDESREIKVEDIFNDEKREKVKRVILQHKTLKDIELLNPVHLTLSSDGYGEFPNGYKLTEKGIQYIIEQLNKE